MSGVEWQPIAAKALEARIEQARTRMTPAQQRLWEAIRISPQKWHQHPYGDPGNGFWVVGLIGQTVVWYNDIEDGFNRSRFSTFGTIDDYWCNNDELDVTLQYLLSALEHGSDLLRLVRDWAPKPR
jgi:hypothetical protein